MVNKVHHLNSSLNTKKKKVKRLSSSRYYPSAYISNPCDQLFGPQPLSLNTSNQNNTSLNNSTTNEIENDEQNVSQTIPITASSSLNDLTQLDRSSLIDTTNSSETTNAQYIPTPRWNKVQNAILEDLFKKSRYPKQSDLKSIAIRLNVMDSDVEEWFRRRRGKDRKTRRKNEALKSLIDKYIDK